MSTESESAVTWDDEVDVVVIPIRPTDDWGLITRTIVPIINQPALFRGGENALGMGDINPSLFLSPSKPRKFVWGVTPALH